MKLKRRLLLLAVLAALAAAHLYYWYMPRERAAVPPAPTANGAPLQGLATGAYDVCLWVPYPHQNLGVLASSVADLPEVVAAATRLGHRPAGAAAATAAAEERPRAPMELPAFGPFEVPPADELLACADLAGGRLRVAARIYPILTLVAKAAGRLAGNPWLAGGQAGRMRIRWDGRLWSVTAGEERPAAPAPAGPAQPAEIPPSLAVVRWAGGRSAVPAGWYALRREGDDLALSLVGSGAAGATGTVGAAATAADRPPVTGAALLAVVGPDWHGALPLGGAAAAGIGAGAARRAGQAFDPTRPMWTGYPRPGGGSEPSPPPDVQGSAGSGAAPPAGAPPPPPAGPLPPAALALFETGSSRLSLLGELPGLAVFNVPEAAAGHERWRLPAASVFRLAEGRLPTADRAGWRILAIDPASLRQAEALAPQLSILVPPAPLMQLAVALPPGAPPAAPAALAGAPAAAAPPPPAGPTLSLGVWLDPRATLRIVSRIRRFVDGFPLASRADVQLWRDWETVLDPLGRCDHAVLTATTIPPSLRLLVQGCTTVIPHPAGKDDS